MPRREFYEVLARDGIDERTAAKMLAGPRLPRRSMTLGDARTFIDRWGDSYTRIPWLIRLSRRPELSPDDILTLLGYVWDSCDNVGYYSEEIRGWLPDITCPLLMNEPERFAMSLLPAVMPVYRGAERHVNEVGLSWSLDRVVAARFPFQLRYRVLDPVLVTGTVERDQIIALKLMRDEREAIIKVPIRVLSIETLYGPPIDD